LPDLKIFYNDAIRSFNIRHNPSCTWINLSMTSHPVQPKQCNYILIITKAWLLITDVFALQNVSFEGVIHLLKCCYRRWPLLWSSGQIYWQQIQRSRLDSQRYQISRKVVGLKRGPLSLVSTTEELLGRNSSGSGLESREYGSGNPLSWPRDTVYPQMLAVTSPTSGCRSVQFACGLRPHILLFLLWDLPIVRVYLIDFISGVNRKQKMAN
jgi:hypothetical protein